MKSTLLTLDVSGAGYGPNNGQQGYGGPPSGGGHQFAGQEFLNDPMANMAMQYGTNLAGQGKEMLQSKVIIISAKILSHSVCWLNR